MASIPNFFIVGAPKCGTTALSEYLRDHPQVFFSPKKEVHYFATNLPNYRRVTRETDYLSFFSAATPRHKALGEGSVYYLYSGLALENIKAFNPEAKVIVMLRNPIDLVYSLHSQLFYSCNEDEPDFAKAWELQQARERGRHVPRTCRDPKVLLYEKVGMLGAQCERLLEVFPRGQVKFILAEDFRSRTPAVYREILEFLGVEPQDRQDFRFVNESKVHRSRLLGRFTQRPPAAIALLARTASRLLHVERLGVMRRLRDLNRERRERRPLDDEFRRRLADVFRDDTARLARVIGHDLLAPSMPAMASGLRQTT
jgi:hypothetical protein